MKQRMTRAGAAWLAAVLFAVAAAPSSAHAQPAAKPVDPMKIDYERARRAYQKGNLALRQGRYEDAEAAYLEAWSIVTAYDVAANLGLVALKLQKPREAAERLDYSLRTAPVDVDRKKVARVREFLAEAKRQIGTLQVPPFAPEIAVWIDGVNIKPSPLAQEVFVDPGTHRILVQREGYAESVLRIEAQPGSVHEVSLSLEPLPPPAPPKASAPAPRPAAERSDDPLIAMGAMSAAWLGAGLGLTIVSNSAGEEAGSAAASRSDRLGAAAGASYVMSGALVLGAVTYALWPRAAPAQTGRVYALPAVSAGGAGLTLWGEW